MHVSAVVRAEVTLLSDSNNNEQLFINLATVMGRRISIIPPSQSCGRKRQASHDISHDTTFLKLKYLKSIETGKLIRKYKWV